MPTCKNDYKKSYKGNEPSPKGYGWCAHAEKINTIKTGTNGKKWIVKKFINGKKWVIYKETNNLMDTYNLEYQKIKDKMKKYKKYFIWDRFHLLSVPYLIYINDSEVHIYTIKNPKKILKKYDNLPVSSFETQTKNCAWAYTKYVKSYKFIKKYYDKAGHGFLFYLGNKQYISIDTNGIYNFIIDDIIEKYISDDDNYPMIIGKKNVYFLIEMDYVDRSLFPVKIDPEHVYEKYFGKKEKIKKGKKITWEFTEEPLTTKKMNFKQLSPKDFGTWYRMK